MSSSTFSTTTKNNNGDTTAQAAAAKDENHASDFQTIIEGSTTMRYPASQEESQQTVFYNPVQVQNRDLSILMITLATERRAVRRAVQEYGQELKQKRREQAQQQQAQKQQQQQGAAPQQQQQQGQKLPTFKEQLAAYEQELLPKATQVLRDQMEKDDEIKTTNGIDIMDALAASGLRSIRYWQEIPGVRHVLINDLDAGAIDRALDNIKVNGLQDVQVMERDGCGIRLQVGDAMHEMYTSRASPATAATTTSQQPGMMQRQWDVIDLDPYGSAAPFMDGAVQAIVDGGMLCVTCTDMAALGGSHPETAYGRYASMPLQRASYLQEVAVRTVLYALATSAAKYGRTIRPVLSVGMDFYIRIFCTVHDDKAAVQNLSLQIGSVYQSTQCQSFFIVPSGQMGGKKGRVYQAGRIHTNAADKSGTCSSNAANGATTNKQQQPDKKETTGDDSDDEKSSDRDDAKKKKKKAHQSQGGSSGSKDNLLLDASGGGNFKIGGPLWLGPMHDQDVVREALKRLEALPDPKKGAAQDASSSSSSSLRFISTRDRLRGLLSNCLEELPDAPLFYKVNDMSKTLHHSTPSRHLVCSALINAGYQVSGYHKDPLAVKTNAPDHVVWDILRAFCRQEQNRNPKKASPAQGRVAERILSQEPKLQVDFTPVSGYKGAGGGGGRKRGNDDVARFPLNPQAHWGPKKAATGAGAPKNKKRKVQEQEQKQDSHYGE